jgi:serine protease
VHGSHVSGCAAAVTDNATGVAGAGFRCRFLPVKTSFDNSITSIDHGYEGIVYAADHGCSVINCSWGRRGGPSQFEQDIIDYATVNRGALVVASAGNQGKEADFYPASYRHVLSVAATNQYDNKSGFSNYSYFVDLCAPGDSINSTVYNDTYGALSGTSMSAPLVSGCAAILRSFRPALTADQAGMQLRATCDDIYSVGGNAAFSRRLGKGRVNLFRALTDSLTPGVEVTSRKITDAAHANFLPGDTLYLTALFTNLLHPTSALTVTLSTAAAYVSLLDSTFAAGVLGTLDTVSNFSVPYRIVLSPSTPTNAATEFTLTLRDGGYTDFYSFRINLNTDYLNITVNDVSTTVNSRGRFGYNQVDQTEGLGFTYLSDQSLLYEGGLMVGYSQAAVSNCVRNTGAGADNDFVLTDRIRVVPAVVADFDAAGRFGDGAAAVPVPVTVTQAVYAWNNDPYRKFIVLRYALKNSGISPRSNLYAGLFADWDIANYTHNRCAEDAARKMGYAWSADTGLFGGVKVLSQTPFGHYAVDNDSSGLGGLNLTDGFSTAEKYLSMTTSRAQAGVFGQGKDVIDIVSTGPFTLAPGDSVIVAFAVLAGDSLASLQASADAAQVLYDSLLTAVREIPSGSAWGIVAVFPNPARGDATLEVETDTYGPVRYAVTDLSGRTVATRDEAPRPPGRHRVTLGVSSLSTGLYLVRMQSGTRNMTVRLSVIRE